MTLSSTRASFRAALADINNHPLADPEQYPAFLNPTASLPRLPRTPLPDLPSAHAHSASTDLTLASAKRQLAEGSLTITQLTANALEAIKKRNTQLNAFVEVASEDLLMAQARELDAELKQGRSRGPLHGLPISVKDVIAVKGMLNTASSKVLAGRVAEYDAASVQLLREAGALIVGKTHTHEFALGVTTPQSRNPWDESRDPGGSSGGSAIAVSTGMSLASLGTDTRASIRVPASLCGVVGYKPTFGLVPTEGITTLSWSLDHAAPMARTVEDIALLMNVLANHPLRSADYTSSLQKDVRGLRIGVPVAALENAEPDVLTAFNNSVDALHSAGAQIIETDRPTAQEFDLAVSIGLILSRCEAAAYHTQFNAPEELYTPVVYQQLDEARQVPALAYLQGQRYRAAFREAMLNHMQSFDALLMPTTRVTAPKTEDVDQYFLVLSLNCIAWSFIGFPAISIPCGKTPSGLPVGAQLVAAPLEDDRLLSVAAALETGLQQQ